MRMAVVGSHDMAVLRNHMQWQFLGPHAMAVLGPICNAICRHHIRLSVLGTTCNGNYVDHIWQFLGPQVWQFWGPYSMTVLGKLYDGSIWTHMRWQLWGPHTDGNSGVHVQSQIISRDIIAGKHKRCILWGQQAMSVLGTTSYTGVKLKSLPSGVRILNCHTFSYRA